MQAIDSLSFGEDLTVTAMISKEKERVPFDKPMQAAGGWQFSACCCL